MVRKTRLQLKFRDCQSLSHLYLPVAELEDGAGNAEFHLADPEDDDGNVFFISTSLRWSMITVISVFHCFRWSMSKLVSFFDIHSRRMHVRLHSECVLFFWIGIDLNLSLDEFDAVDFDYVQDLAGKHGY
jgi:hypothetical protein